MSLLSIPRYFWRLYRPGLQALFTWNLPWRYRWRLLVLQPLSLITYGMSSFPYLFTQAYRVEYLPIAPGRTVRCIIFKPAGAVPAGKLRPLHIDIHGGGFLGGQPEDEATFCEAVARETGAVVVGIHYRYAPVDPFPAAHDDVDAAIRYLLAHAEEKLGADPTLLTVSGFSAGGNLALAAAQAEACHAPSPTSIKGCATFFAAIDLRLKPEEKPVPPNYPTSDPLMFMLPLYDAYAAPVRAANMDNPRLSPVIAPVDKLPENMFVGIAAIDILVHEQETFVERVTAELAADKRNAGRRIEAVRDPKGFHGYLNLPEKVIPWEKKAVLYDPAIRFLKEVQQKYGWSWE